MAPEIQTDEVERAWWRRATTLNASLEDCPAPPSSDWYRIGDGYLGIASADEPFGTRLRRLFLECAVAGPQDSALPSVHCTVRVTPDGSYGQLAFDDPEPLDQPHFILTVFPDRGYRTSLPAPDGWQVLTSDNLGSALVLDATRVLVRRDEPWQALAGNLAVHRLFRLQRNTVFLHAGAVAVGTHGLLLIGGKGSGKTTVALALASRGHALLGDEYAGVRVRSRELVPVRRSLAIRDGPRAAAVNGALERVPGEYDIFPDGTPRRRAYARELFPDSAAISATLRHLVFLCGFAPEPRLDPVLPGRQHLARLTPLAVTLWGRSPAESFLLLLSLVTDVQCWLLHAGPPDQTADLLETIGDH